MTRPEGESVTRRSPIAIPVAGEAPEVPTYRFWGSQKPPKNRADFWSFVTAAAAEGETSTAGTAVAGSVATLRMYGPIDSWGGWWGISAGDVAEALDAIGDVDEIRIRINSPGGECWEAMAILNMLRAHKAKVVAVVDGIAASAASFLAAGCDDTVMSPGTQMMIHDASSFAYGPADTMEQAKKFLDSISNSMALLYAEAAGGDADAWRSLMKATTWYTAPEAVTSGLADRVAVVKDAGQTSTTAPDDDLEDYGDEIDASVEARFDLSIYPYAGRSKAPAPRPTQGTPKPPTASADGTPKKEGPTLVDFTPENIAALRQQVGFAEDADADTITASVIEALDERATDDTPPATASGTGLPAAILAQLGLPATADEATVSSAFAQMHTNATAGAAAAEQLRVQERESFLDSHRDRFVPAARTSWQQAYDQDAETARTALEAAAVIVPLDEVGHDVPNADAKQDDAWFPQFPAPTAKEA